MVVSFLKSVENYALQLSGHTDGRTFATRIGIHKVKKYHTPPCYPYMITKRRNTIRANARAETRLRRKLKRANARAERA